MVVRQSMQATQDAAELQQLIRYVERWRLAHFQRCADRRLRDADDLLKKLRRGFQLAAQAGAVMTDSVTEARAPSYLY